MIKIYSDRTFNQLLRLDWRLCWYSVLVWLMAVIIAGFVVLPWFYAVLPLMVLATTALYFRFPKKSLIPKSYTKSGVFAHGLWLGLLWFAAIFLLDFIEFVGFEFGNFYIYSIDARNFLKYPLVILIPVIYSLMIEDFLKKRNRRTKNHRLTDSLTH